MNRDGAGPVPVPECGSDLTAGIEASLVLAGEGVVSEVVETQSGVVTRH